MRRHQHPYRLWPLQKRKARKGHPSESIAKVVDRNIRVVEDYRAEVERQRTLTDRVADWITRWAGSMAFVYMHVAWFGLWLQANVNLFGIEPFDPYPFGLLTTIVSLEAIFLSTFVLVSQNRQARVADRRTELDLQINLLTEYEMTRVLTLVDAIARKLEVADGEDDELAELEVDVKPEELLQELDERDGSNAEQEPAADLRSDGN
ncbi:MAG TPA: DUF1003 domain-containing protein [Lacipirellula sp.]